MAKPIAKTRLYALYMVLPETISYLHNPQGFPEMHDPREWLNNHYNCTEHCHQPKISCMASTLEMVAVH